MFRLFITNHVLLGCLGITICLARESAFRNDLLTLFWLAVICVAVSSLYGLLKMGFRRLEAWGKNIFFPVFIFGMLVFFAVFAAAASSAKLESNTMLGVYAFVWMMFLSALAWRYQRLLSLLTFPWMIGYGMLLGVVADLGSGYRTAVKCYAICYVLLLLGFALLFVVGFFRGSEGVPHQHPSSEESDGIPPGGYGSSHV